MASLKAHRPSTAQAATELSCNETTVFPAATAADLAADEIELSETGGETGWHALAYC